MNSLGTVPVGGHSPVRVMGIINASPESFYKKSVFTEKRAIAKTAKQMEEDGADFIDIGGMSTAPYLKTLVSENKEIERITNAVEAVQKVSRLPISIDTCRASVAEAALDLGAEIINDISGLKYDKDMPRILDEYRPSVVVCSYSKKLVTGNQIIQARNLLHESIAIAKKAHIINNKIVVDPAVGFFRRRATGRFFTKIDSDWLKRDVLVLQNLRLIKDGHPLLVSVSRKSFVGNLLNEPNPEKRLYGSLAAETICVLNGADIIRTHNVKATRDAIKIAQRLGNFRKGL